MNPGGQVARIHIACIVVASCVACLLIDSPAEAGMKVDINFALGGKGLDEDDWGDADSQGLFGVETTFGNPHWPVAIAIDYMVSAKRQQVLVTSPVLADVDLVQGTAELDGGVRKIWEVGRARPFVGGGFGILAARQERNIQLATVDDTDSTIGVWLNGGCFWRLGKRFNLGVDLRFSGGEVELFGRDVEAGGASLALLLGWGWGGADR